MKIILNNLKLHSSRHGNFRLAKRKGKEQWTTLGYYDTIPEGLEALLNAAGWAIDAEIDLNQELKRSIDRFIAEYKKIKNDILNAFDNLKKGDDDENSR